MEEQEKAPLTFKTLAVSFISAGIMAALDFVSYLIMVLYMTGLAAGAISGLLYVGLSKYPVQLPTFLAIWAVLASLRIVIRSFRLEM